MNRCPSERRLLLVHMGEGSTADGAHVRACSVCAARSEELAADLARLQGVLLDPPPRLSRPRAYAAWIPAGALAAAAVVMLAIIGPSMRQSPTVIATRSDGVTAFATDVSSALFAGEATPSSPQVIDVAYLQAAVDQLPCASGDVDGQCDPGDGDVGDWDE